MRRETIARRPHEEEVAHATARHERKVTRPSAQPAGMASMGIFGPAEDMHQLWTALDARARQAKAADAKGRHQRR
jgi:hypothetical protein